MCSYYGLGSASLQRVYGDGLLFIKACHPILVCFGPQGVSTCNTLNKAGTGCNYANE